MGTVTRGAHNIWCFFIGIMNDFAWGFDPEDWGDRVDYPGMLEFLKNVQTLAWQFSCDSPLVTDMDKVVVT